MDKVDIYLGDLGYEAFDWLQLKCIILEDDEKDYITVEYEVDHDFDTDEPFIDSLSVEGVVISEADGEAFLSLKNTVQAALEGLVEGIEL